VDRDYLDRVNAKRTDPLERYREYVEFQLAIDGEGWGLREARDRLAENHQVGQLDALVVESISRNDYINPILLQDDLAKPWSDWWWHLGAIRAGTFPAEALPENLRAIYRPPAARRLG